MPCIHATPTLATAQKSETESSQVKLKFKNMVRRVSADRSTQQEAERRNSDAGRRPSKTFDSATTKDFEFVHEESVPLEEVADIEQAVQAAAHRDIMRHLSECRRRALDNLFIRGRPVRELVTTKDGTDGGIMALG